MSKISISWEGDKELGAALKKKASLKAIKQVVKKNTAQLEQLEKTFMGRGGVYVKGYSKGNNKRSTNLSLENGGLTGKVTTTSDHIIYIEKGTRYMAAEPAVKPAFERQSKIFTQDLKNLVK